MIASTRIGYGCCGTGLAVILLIAGGPIALQQLASQPSAALAGSSRVQGAEEISSTGSVRAILNLISGRACCLLIKILFPVGAYP